MPLDLENVQSGYNLTVINENFQRIEDTWDEKLDRVNSGSFYNQMEQELDMNSNHIINSPAPTEETHLVRLKELNDLVFDSGITGVLPLVQPRQVGDGSTTVFAAPNSSVVSAATMFISIDGVMQRPFTDYDVLAANQVTFTEAVPNLATVDITYFEPRVIEDPDVSLRTAKATGTTAARTLGDRFADTVNVKDFGAVGDGVTDDTSAIQACFNYAASSNKKVMINAPHVFTETLTFVSDNRIEIEFENNGELLCTNSTLDYGIWVSGLAFQDVTNYWDVTLRTGAISLVSDITQYDREITVASGHGLVKGDWIRIGSTDQHTPLRTQYRKGELHQIQEVNGDIISLDSSTFDSYDMTTTWVFKTPMPSVRLINPRVTGLDDENDIRGVVLWECANVLVDTPTINGFNDNGLDLSFCVDVAVNKPTINFSTKSYSGGGRTSYGLVVNSSQSVTVDGGTIKGGRHSFATGGYDPNRFLVVKGVTIMSNDVDDLDVAAMDSHENLVGMDVVNCTIYGGANLAGQDINFSNNTVVIAGEVLRAVVFRPAITCDYIIAEGNSVNTTSEAAGGIVVRHYADNVAIRKVATNNNAVAMNTSFARLGIGFEPVQPNGQKVELWECRGNQVTINSTAVGATCLGNWDSGDLANRVDFAVANIDGNYLFNDNGNCLGLRQKTEARIGTLNINNNTMISRNFAVFSLLYFKYVNFHNNEAIGDTNTTFNQVRFTDNFNWSDSRITFSDYFGCRLLDVDSVQETNITRENCLDTGVEYSQTFGPTAHCWGVYDETTDSAVGAYNCSIAQNGAVGRYLVTWGADNRHPQEFFNMIATPQFDGRAYCIPNNFTSCFVFLRDSAGSPTAGEFSFVSF